MCYAEVFSQLDASQNRLPIRPFSLWDLRSWFYKLYALPVILWRQPAALLHLVGFHWAVGRDPKPLARLASLHAHKTMLEAGHKPFSPKDALLTDHRFVWGSTHLLHPMWQGCRRYTQMSLQGCDDLHCVSWNHPHHFSLGKTPQKPEGTGSEFAKG